MPTPTPTTDNGSNQKGASLMEAIAEASTRRKEGGRETILEAGAKDLIQLVVFELMGEEYAVDIMDVREIMKMEEVTPVPNSPDFIEGIINVRGTIDVIVDLARRFNLKETGKAKRGHIINVERGENLYGLIVDEVSEVLRIPKDTIEAAPGIISQEIRADYVKGVALVEDRLLILLDLDKVLSEIELTKIAEQVHKTEELIHRKEEREVAETKGEGKKGEKEESEEEHKEKVEKLAEEREKRLGK